MRQRIAVLAAGVGISLGALAASAPVSAAPIMAPTVAASVDASLPASSPATVAVTKQGAACVAAGIRTLVDLGLLRDAALRRIDYSTLADPDTGPIFTTLPAGSYLSLGAVIRLHLTNPELFAWCR